MNYFYKEILMTTQKFNELELYLMLRMQAKLVEQTKYTVLDKIFKTGRSGGNNVSVFSLLGVLLDLQNLNVLINLPGANEIDKVDVSDLVAFIAKNYSKMNYTNKKFKATGDKKTILNWIILSTQTFENKFTDFIDYLQNDLHISLILPSNTITTKQQLNVEDSLLALSKIEANLNKKQKQLDEIGR